MKSYQYKNGNTTVQLLSDGTKIREFEGTPEPTFPESIDLKITNYCDLFKLCQFCHEASNMSGKHADLGKFHFLLEQLPNGAELAIGGGNPLAHPDLLTFLTKARDENVVCNLTINEQHLKPFRGLLKQLIEDDLVKGVGISYTGKRPKDVEYFCNLSKNVVFHVIMGIHDIDDLEVMRGFTNKVLILGYKHFRKGNSFYEKHSEEVEKNLYQWYIGIPRYFKNMTLSFDNLAISQLKLERWFPQNSWDQFYMGDDGTFTMYIDAVKQKFAKSSTSKNTFDVNGDIEQMFNAVKSGN